MHKSLIARALAVGLIFCLVGRANAADTPTSAASEPLAATAPDDSGRIDHSFFFENDASYINPFNGKDRHYTNGVKFLLAFHPEWMTDVAEFLPFNPTSETYPTHTSIGATFGQSIFTPIEKTPAPIPTDEPYAGWLYGSVFIQRATDTVFDHFEITFGMIGPAALGEQIQNGTHKIFGVDTFDGWDNQLHDEPQIDFSYQRRWRLYKARLFDDVGFDLIPHAGLTLGTLNRNADIGTTARLGLNLPGDFGPGSIMHPQDYTIAPDASEPIIYLFGRVNGRYVEHNAILEGNNWHNSQGVHADPFVGYFTFGVEVQPVDWLALSWSNTFKTREFYGQDSMDSYGTVLATIHFEF